MSIRKPSTAQHGHHTGESAAVALVKAGQILADPIPKPPPGLSAASLRLWNEAWSSDVSGVWDRASDLGLARRWIVSADEAERLRRAIRRSGRLTTGSVGQLRPSAFYKLLEIELRVVEHAEDRLGLNPAARFHLGLTALRAGLTAQELNLLVDRDGPTAMPPEFADEFESV